MIVLGIIIGLLVLTTLVIGHEFGHFIMARRNGVKVNEFGIGFPPRAIAWVRDKKTKKWKRLPKKDWEKPQNTLILSINWLPIGGFCSMDGESDADTKPHTFGAATFWQKTKILFGGVMMNWLMAFIILTILAWTGMPHMIEGQFSIENDTTTIGDQSVKVDKVIEGSPAEKSGLQSGDIIKAAVSYEHFPHYEQSCKCNANKNGDANKNEDADKDKDDIKKYSDALFEKLSTKFKSSSDLTAFNRKNADEKVIYQILRDDKLENVIVVLNPSDADYILGISMAQEGQFLYRSTWSAPIVGAATTVQLTGETFKGFGMLIGNLFSGVARQFSPDEATRAQGRQDIGTVGDSVSGPIGIIGTLFPAFTAAGATNVAFLAALISISLACMNVLPIPALDGGRWLLIAIFRLRKKPLTTEVEGKIVSRAFIFLIGLTVLITVLDIMRLFR